MLPNLIGITDPQNYALYLKEKCEHILNLFKQHNFQHPKEQIFASDPTHYRMRAEFAVFFVNNDNKPYFEYTMFYKEKGEKKRLFINEYTVGAKPISELMIPLREEILKDTNIFHKLFEIDFLVNLSQECVIIFHYHKKINDPEFKLALEKLLSSLLQFNFKVKGIVAHAKKEQVIIGDPFVIEKLTLNNGHEILLKQVEGTFSQPNARTCINMLNFAISCTQDQKEQDLLELYCGSGTFTTALAPYFRQVLATEICRVPTQTALYNLDLNHISNTKLVRLSAVEVSEALNKVREFTRLKLANINLDDYNFKTLLIDPPRSGLNDEQALAFTAKFDRIIYISCGMDSLVSDLDYLTQSHTIKKVAFFDQFPYTKHLESGVLLVKNSI